MTKNSQRIALSAGLLSIIGVAALAQIGPLAPPAGPVADTEPSLASIDQRLDSIHDLIARPPAFRSISINTSGTVDLTPDPVLIRAVVVSRTSDFAFLRSSIGDVYAIFTQENAAAGRIDLDIVAPNGLQLEHRGPGNTLLTVLYDPLPASQTATSKGG
ncbi:MAG: hypothetical protein AAFR38_08425 [Planctomycetota bacterium]